MTESQIKRLKGRGLVGAMISVGAKTKDFEVNPVDEQRRNWLRARIEYNKRRDVGASIGMIDKPAKKR